MLTSGAKPLVPTSTSSAFAHSQQPGSPKQQNAAAPAGSSHQQQPPHASAAAAASNPAGQLQRAHTMAPAGWAASLQYPAPAIQQSIPSAGAAEEGTSGTGSTLPPLKAGPVGLGSSSTNGGAKFIISHHHSLKAAGMSPLVAAANGITGTASQLPPRSSRDKSPGTTATGSREFRCEG